MKFLESLDRLFLSCAQIEGAHQRGEEEQINTDNLVGPEHTISLVLVDDVSLSFHFTIVISCMFIDVSCVFV